MARRLGITHDEVVEAGFAIVDSSGLDSLRISGVAHALGVKPPSLYSHVNGLGGLLDEMSIRATAQFGTTLADSVGGLANAEAVAAFANSYRSWATDYPGRYQLTLRKQADPGARRAAGSRALEAIDSVLAGFGLEGTEAANAGRSLRAALHGFVTLEAEDGLGRGSHDTAFSYLITLVVNGIQAPTPFL